jgi:hypothetical protein
MHDIFSREPDPLDGMLAPPALPPDADALRQDVYARTRRVLRRRRHLRQFAYVGGLAASFAAGLLVMWMTLPARSASKETPLPVPSASKETPPLPNIPATQPEALAQEWRAFDSEDQRGEVYKQAGDRYMTEESDPQSALRCYSISLDNGTEQDISTDDNWLLMAIKIARQKEKDHAKTGG